jgi:PKD repeat protein
LVNPPLFPGDGSIELTITSPATNYTIDWAYDSSNHTTILSGISGGPYDVTVTDNTTGCVESETIVVPGPTAIAPTADFSVDKVQDCGTLAATFTDLSTGTPPLTWAWTFGDGGTATVQNPTHTYTAAGVYTVTLTVTNGAGSDTKTSTGLITVNSKPVITLINVTNVSSYGYADGAITIAVSGGSGTHTIAWADDATETGTTRTGLTEGTYTVIVTDANGCVVDLLIPVTTNVVVTPPSNVYFDIVIPEIEGIITNPGSGTLSIEQYSSFILFVNALEGYSLEGITVTFNGVTIYPQFLSDGTLAFAINGVTGNIVITITGVKTKETTGIANIKGTRVYTDQNFLYVELNKRDELYIFTLNGLLYKHITVAPGTNVIQLPNGIYIVRTDNSVWKVLIKD